MRLVKVLIEHKKFQICEVGSSSRKCEFITGTAYRLSLLVGQVFAIHAKIAEMSKKRSQSSVDHFAGDNL